MFSFHSNDKNLMVTPSSNTISITLSIINDGNIKLLCFDVKSNLTFCNLWWTFITPTMAQVKVFMPGPHGKMINILPLYIFISHHRHQISSSNCNSTWNLLQIWDVNVSSIKKQSIMQICRGLGCNGQCPMHQEYGLFWVILILKITILWSWIIMMTFLIVNLFYVLFNIFLKNT